MYPVSAVPPLAGGGLQVIVACLSPKAPATAVGIAGSRSGVAHATAEAGPEPCWFRAETLKWYGKPFNRVAIEYPVPVEPVDATRVPHENPPSTAYSMRYPEMAEPPTTVGVVHARVIWLGPAVAVRPVGAPGVANGVAVAVAEGTPVPTAVTAETRNWCTVPDDRPTAA
jgi:hypothetical protein